MDKEISPPPTKKRRLENKQETSVNNTTYPNHDKPTLSIYSWNINGIFPFIQRPITSFFNAKASPSKTSEPPPTASLRDFLRRQNWPTLLFLQEVKINPSDETTKAAVERAVACPKNSKGNEPDYKAFFNLPSDPHNARGFGRKVYGVCTIVRSDFQQRTSAKVRSVDWDLEGRVLILETNETAASSSSPSSPSSPLTSIPKLSIMNLYSVNGTSNAYKSPLTGAITGTRHTHKLALHAHLLHECQRLESQGYKVILAGDMNIARAPIDGHPNLRVFPEEHVKNRKDFNDKFFDGGEGLRGVDTYRHVHGEGRKGYTYYPRGRAWGSSCDRVDMVICSASLKDNIASAGILETAADRGPSDHCPLYATFDFSSLKTTKVDSNGVD